MMYMRTVSVKKALRHNNHQGLIRSVPFPTVASIRSRDSCTCNAQAPDGNETLVSRFPGFFRGLPLIAGGLGFGALLLNRLLSKAAPFLDGGSSQSRVDVLVIALAATLALTGFQWLALKPVELKQVDMIGKQSSFMKPGLKPACRDELQWAWDALSSSTCCKSLSVMVSRQCVFQAGILPEGGKPGQSVDGAISKKVMSTGKANFLANLVLFPGRTEFAEIIPANTSCVIVAPIGDRGVLIAGGDTQRGFGKVDQAWITTIADKLDDTFETLGPGGAGFQSKKK